MNSSTRHLQTLFRVYLDASISFNPLLSNMLQKRAVLLANNGAVSNEVLKTFIGIHALHIDEGYMQAYYENCLHVMHPYDVPVTTRAPSVCAVKHDQFFTELELIVDTVYTLGKPYRLLNSVCTQAQEVDNYLKKDILPSQMSDRVHTKIQQQMIEHKIDLSLCNPLGHLL